MYRETYQTLTKITYLIFFSSLSPTIIFLDEIRIAKILATICLISGLCWSLMSLFSKAIEDRLLPKPTKYRLRVESTNIESKYILESKKPGSSYWLSRGVFTELETAIEQKQELENQEINKIQIINL